MQDTKKPSPGFEVERSTGWGATELNDLFVGAPSLLARTEIVDDATSVSSTVKYDLLAALLCEV